MYTCVLRKIWGHSREIWKSCKSNQVHRLHKFLSYRKLLQRIATKSIKLNAMNFSSHRDCQPRFKRWTVDAFNWVDWIQSVDQVSATSKTNFRWIIFYRWKIRLRRIICPSQTCYTCFVRPRFIQRRRSDNKSVWIFWNLESLKCHFLHFRRRIYRTLEVHERHKILKRQHFSGLWISALKFLYYIFIQSHGLAKVSVSCGVRLTRSTFKNRIQCRMNVKGETGIRPHGDIRITNYFIKICWFFNHNLVVYYWTC